MMPVKLGDGLAEGGGAGFPNSETMRRLVDAQLCRGFLLTRSSDPALASGFLVAFLKRRAGDP